MVKRNKDRKADVAEQLYSSWKDNSRQSLLKKYKSNEVSPDKSDLAIDKTKSEPKCSDDSTA